MISENKDNFLKAKEKNLNMLDNEGISFVNKAEYRNIFVPDIGTDEKMEVIEIMVQVGDKIIKEQSLISIEGDKTSIEIPSPFSGVVKKINVSKGDMVQFGSLIVILKIENLNTSAELNKNLNTISINSRVISSPKEKKLYELHDPIDSTNQKDKSIFKKTRYFVHASPMVRRLAREFEVDLCKISGTGRKGRILREDLDKYLEEITKKKKSIAHDSLLKRKEKIFLKEDFSKFGKIEEILLSKTQKISGKNLQRNWNFIPHVTVMEEIDFTELENFRKKQNEEIKKKNSTIKITPLVFVLKIVSYVLKEMPYFNSSILEDSQKLILKKYINIGIAVDTVNGLVVPVIRNVIKKGILELSEELIEISKKARAGKLTFSDFQGGTFTISSLGGIGTIHFTPIINYPEVAIIGLSRFTLKPVWDGKQFVPRLILPISLSFDHRVIDGADAARFIMRVSQLIKDIRLLMM